MNDTFLTKLRTHSKNATSTRYPKLVPVSFLCFRAVKTNMAAEEVVLWSSVVGEYGVLLTEMGSMEDLCTPIKAYPRIKYTCMTVSRKYVTMGSSTGGLYVFDRKTLKHPRFISNKDGPVHAVCLSQQRSLLAVATSVGIVLVWMVGSRHREKPKLIRRSEEHKNSTITALCWDDEEGRLFAGDMKGVVSVVRVPPAKLPHSVNKSLPLLYNTTIVAKAHTGIVQLDCVGDKLLVSTMSKCAVVDLKSLDCVPVGVKLRDGFYGSCFVKESLSDSPTIYSARPGSRLWEASIDGQVMATQQYKKLLAIPPVPILGCGHSAVVPLAEGDFPPQSVNFAQLLLVRERFLVTWHGTSLYIIDPILGQLVAWYSLDTEILNVCCVGAEIYAYLAEGFVRWFGLLSVKECVAKLFEMGELKQCLEVLLDCRHYIIPGSARDMVPVSLVTSLREGLCEENNEEDQDVIHDLNELERDMEPPTELCDNPPSYLGNLGMTDSPDTLSVCSDAVSEDLDVTVLSPGARELEDNDDGMLGKAGLHSKLSKKWSADISFEGILMSAAAAAKRFTSERQLGVNKLKRSQSADTSPTGNISRSKDGDVGAEDNVNQQETGIPQRKPSSDSDAFPVGEEVKGALLEEESPLLQRAISEHSPYHSDDSESRQSGNEGGVVEEETLVKKEKLTAKDKRKKKKSRVVTVDIDSPQLKPELFLDASPSLARSPSFRGTRCSTDDIETRRRCSSEPVSPAQAELPPAIPSMFSKAKGLLKKKLKPSAEDPSPLPSPSLSPIPLPEETAGYWAEPEETEEIKSPKEVKELIECSSKARSHVKNPAVLFSTTSLCRVFEEWIPKLHEAMKSCLELTLKESGNNSDFNLKHFLSGSAFEEVSYLAQMCFDCGIFGPEGLHSLEDVVNSEETTSKTTLSGIPMEQDKLDSINADISIDENSDEPKEKNPDLQVSECIPSSHGDSREAISNENYFPLGFAEQSCTSTEELAPSMKTNVVKGGNFDVNTSVERSDDSISDMLSENADSETFGPLKASLHDVNKPAQSSSDGTVSSHEKMSPSNSIKLQDSSSPLQSGQSCQQICMQCGSGTAFYGKDRENIRNEGPDDETRSKFMSCYFCLLDVRRIRRTLHMTSGDREKTWNTFIHCLSGLVPSNDVIAKYIREGDARRALHELHDGMDAYCNVLLYHLTCLYENDSRETMLTCARMFPDVQPWEVMEICRHSKLHGLESSSADFVFYVEQLMRWRSEVGITKEQTINKICQDRGITKWWFHCSLIANSTQETLRCHHCAKPRPGSHTITWQNEDHLKQLLDFLCQKDPSELTVFMDLCRKHGYWSGLIRLCVRTGQRQEALQLVASLSDMKLIKDPQPWGSLPKSLGEWKHLLELVLSRDQPDVSRDSTHACATLAASDWLADLTWSNVTKLMLERLGAGHTVNILQALPQDMPLLSTDFFYSCLLGAVVERRQRTLIHELLKKLDSYLWSQRSGSLAPKLNSFRKEEEIWGPKSKEDIKPQLDSFSQFRTLEDGASNWGQNIRLSDGECLVCSLKLCEQISTSNQGLLMFECGHVFHKHCVPEAACVVCFHQNLTSLGSCVQL